MDKLLLNAPVTSFIGGVFGVLYAVLSIRVSMQRGALKVILGDGTVEIAQEAVKGEEAAKLARKRYAPLLKAVRAHANMAEFVPLQLILLLCLEISGSSSRTAQIFGFVILAARLSLTVGISSPGVSMFRRVGAIGTYLTLIGLAGANIVSSYSSALKF